MALAIVSVLAIAYMSMPLGGGDDQKADAVATSDRRVCRSHRQI